MSNIFIGFPSWIIPTLILLISIASLTIILERLWYLNNRLHLLQPEDKNQLLDYVQKGNVDGAISLCQVLKHPASSIAIALLAHKDKSNNQSDLNYTVNDTIVIETRRLEQYLSALGNISTIAPLLGLLGTVTGMIKAFKAFELNISKNTQLFSGIDEALITTALGLIVAVPSLTMYNYFVNRVNMYLQDVFLIVKAIANKLKLDIEIDAK